MLMTISKGWIKKAHIRPYLFTEKMGYLDLGNFCKT